MRISNWNLYGVQSHALCTSTKFQLEILNINIISSILDFRDIILALDIIILPVFPTVIAMGIFFWYSNQYPPETYRSSIVWRLL